MKTTLAEKTNSINIHEATGLDSIIHWAGQIITPKTIQFFANEKNRDLSPMAKEALIWAKKNGFGMSSRPARSQRINKNEFYKDVRQDVIWQWTKYTIK